MGTTLACHALVLSLSTTNDDFRAYHRLVFSFPKLHLAQNRCGSRVVLRRRQDAQEQRAAYPLLRLIACKRATSENSFDGRGDIIAQFLSPLQCSLYPHNLQFSGRDLAGWLVMVKAALERHGAHGTSLSEPLQHFDHGASFVRIPTIESPVLS